MCLFFKFEIKMLEQDSLFHNSFVYEAQNAFVKGDKMSYNFHLLTMPRDRRSFQGLKHAVYRDKFVTFPYLY